MEINRNAEMTSDLSESNTFPNLVEQGMASGAGRGHAMIIGL